MLITLHRNLPRQQNYNNLIILVILWEQTHPISNSFSTLRRLCFRKCNHVWNQRIPRPIKNSFNLHFFRIILLSWCDLKQHILWTDNFQFSHCVLLPAYCITCIRLCVWNVHRKTSVISFYSDNAKLGTRRNNPRWCSILRNPLGEGLFSHVSHAKYSCIWFTRAVYSGNTSFSYCLR